MDEPTPVVWRYANTVNMQHQISHVSSGDDFHMITCIAVWINASLATGSLPTKPLFTVHKDVFSSQVVKKRFAFSLQTWNSPLLKLQLSEMPNGQSSILYPSRFNFRFCSLTPEFYIFRKEKIISFPWVPIISLVKISIKILMVIIYPGLC